MKKRIKWTYEARLDHICPPHDGKWVIGFVNEKSNPYECPTATDAKLIEKLEQLVNTGRISRLMVAVEINEKMDDKTGNIQL